MLKISPAVTVTGVPGQYKNTQNSYILFPDSEDTNMYYALAENPTFLADANGIPSLNLTWYFGSGIESAGICTMTVALPMPDTSKPDVANKILSALTTDQSTRNIATQTFDLCQAMDANDAAKVTALKAALGFNDDAATKKKAVYDKSQGWEQFLPHSGKLDIRPIPFKTGTVTVQAFADPNAYQQQNPAFSTGSIQTTPSLINSNAAVVTFNLKELGANLFWHGLGGWQLDASSKRPDGWDAAKGGSSVLSVTYQVTFDGLLPQAKATVTLDQSIVAKLDIETLTKSGSWGRTYHEDVARGKEYNDAINSATEIVLPSVSSPDDKDNVKQLLTDWAAKQLDDMTKAQLPDVDLGNLDVNGIRQIQQVKKQSRTYVLTQAVTLPKYPQAQLPKIDGIVDSESIKKCFQLINLNDVPFVNVNLTVRPPSMKFLQDRQVDRFVITQIAYAGEKLIGTDGKQVGTLEFLTSAPPVLSQTLSGTFGKNTTDRSIEYSYRVAYTDATPSFQSTTLKQTDNNYLDLGGVDIGVLSVSLDSVDLPWDVINSAKVELNYDTWSKTVSLSKDGPVLVSQPFGKAMTQPLTYTVTLAFATGAPIVGNKTTVQLSQGRADITLKNPLGDTVSPVSFALGDGVTTAKLRAEFHLNTDGSDRTFVRVIDLNASAPSYTWNLPSQSSKASSLKVTKALANNVEIKDLSGGNLNTVAQQPSITVLPDQLSQF